MRRLLSILFLLYSSLALAQQQAVPGSTIRVIDSRFQFVNNETGQPANNQLWDEADPFVNGFSRVFLNNRFSFVNGHGILIAPVVFEDARNFAGKLAAVKKEGKWGFINESGKIIFDVTFDIAFDFEESISVAFNNKTWKLINSNGKVIMPLDITVCFGFKNGKAKIIKDGREGILNPTGEINFINRESRFKDPIPYHPNSNNTAADCPDNIDLEFGNFTNWQCYTGRVDSVGNTNLITVTPSAPTVNRHEMISRVTPSALDPFGLFPTNPPDGSNHAVKLGNTNVGAEAERMTYTIHVPLNDSNFSIKYDYAVVLQDPGHTIWTQPRFNAKLLDSATNTYIDCASFEYISTSGLPGFEVSPVNSSVIFKPWSSVFFSLRGYGGKTLYLEFTTADCVRRAHWGYAYVDVESTCGQAIQVQNDCTFPNATTLTGPPGFQFYNWWDQTFSTIVGTGQQIVLNPGPIVNTVMWLEMIPFANFGCTDTLKVNINGILTADFNISDTIACGPHSFTFYNKNLPSTSTLWNFGDGTTGTGDTVTHTYYAPGTFNVQLRVTVPNGCIGTATHPVIIKPLPIIAQPPNQALCSGTNSNAVIFSGNVNGTIYNWTNTAASVGLPASGTGNIAPFTAISNGAYPAVATITVRPIASGCPGPVKIFTITINPVPDVVQPPNQTLCNGNTTNLVNFTGIVNGTVFRWTNNKPSIGLTATGDGPITAFTAINRSNAPVIATITVTPITANCTGPSKTFTITINPSPAVRAGNDINVCLGNTAQLSVTGAALFNWSPATRLSCTNCANPVTTPIDSIRYIVRGESLAGCIAFDTLLVNVSKPFQMLISPNDTLCIGESTILRANGAFRYLWSPPQGLNRTNVAEPEATPAATTIYRVTGYDEHQCFTDTAYVKITVGPRPTVNLGADLTLATGSVVTLNPVIQNGPIINWAWKASTGLSCTNCPAPVLTVRDNIYYELTVTNNYGCTATDIIAINTFCKSAQVFIPNAFTPDGDGLNDILMVRGKGIFVKTFRIFNRWGELVFEKTNFNPNDLKFGWDGKVRGIAATPDVFVYTADVICDNDILYTYKGNTTILK